MINRSREEAKDYVLKMAKEHDVKFIRMWFTDILGMLKSFAITVEELEGALEEGMGFDGSSIEGFARIDARGGRRGWNYGKPGREYQPHR